MLSIFIAVALAATTFARAFPRPQASTLPGPQPLFTDPTCVVPPVQDTLGYPSANQLFPIASLLGTIIGPTLVTAIGKQSVIDIDQVAEDLCVNANQNPLDDVGICDNLLQLVFDLADFEGQGAATRYSCLLNAICIARNSPQNAGTCQYLLAGADCVANRLIGVDKPECVGYYPPS